jgi:hypothetical protein
MLLCENQVDSSFQKKIGGVQEPSWVSKIFPKKNFGFQAWHFSTI